MTNTDVVNQIINIVRDFMTYMLPVIGTLAGLNFIFTWMMSALWGVSRKTFKE